MPSQDPEVLTLSGTIGAHERHHPGRDLSELRRDLQVAKLADHVRQVVDAAPPLTDAQRIKIAALLLRGGDGA
jgi:hypothetical protein